MSGPGDLPTEIPNIEESLAELGLEKLISRIYNLPYSDPVTFANIPLISFGQALNLFQTNNVARYDMNLLLQPFAGPFGTSNRAVIIQDNSGNRFVVYAQIDNGKLLPPIQEMQT